MMSKEERELVRQQLDAIRTAMQTMTEQAAKLAGQAVNNVLEVCTVAIPTEGYITRQYHVAAGSIALSNMATTATNLMTVTTGGVGSAAPDGTGSYKVAGGTERTIPLASRSLTIWGTAGDRVSFSVFTAAVQPATS